MDIGPAGRDLHSSTVQLNLSHFWHKMHPIHPLIPPNTPYTPPTQPLNAPPVPQEALTLSRKVDECKPLPAGGTGVCQYAGTDGGEVQARGAGAYTRSHLSST